MKHCMKLNISPFRMIESGEKTIELRLYDEKRKKVKKGDIIEFSCAGVDYTLIAKVKEIYIFKDFKELYENLPLEKCGYKGREKDADYSDMYLYYPQEKIQRYGAMGIELEEVWYTASDKL